MRLSRNQKRILLASTIDRLKAKYGTDDFCVRKLAQIYEDHMRVISERVFNAIKSGEATTYRQIRIKFDISGDLLGDILCWLMLDEEVVGSREVDGQRIYYVRERRKAA